MTDKQLFWEHLANSSRIVNEWPEWKRAGMSWTTSKESDGDKSCQNNSSAESKKEIGHHKCCTSIMAEQLLSTD